MRHSAPVFRRITRAVHARVLIVGIVCLVVSSRVPVQAQRARQTLRVLFIGNSYTFYNNLVDMEKMVPLVDLGQPTAAELQKIAWETVTAAAQSAPSASLPGIAPASARASAGR